MKKRFVYLLFILALTSCKKTEVTLPIPVIPVVPAPILSDAKELTTFSFTKAVNPGLATDIIATIDAATHTISATFPSGTVITGLKASFTISANASLKVGPVAQTSATTTNDFTNPLTFVVTAQNGTIQNYVANIKVEVQTSNFVVKREDYLTGQATPYDIVEYTYNASNQLVFYKDYANDMKFEYDANGTLKTKIVYEKNGTVSNTLTYVFNANKQITSITGTYGQTLEVYSYGTGSQIAKIVKSYFGVVKETTTYTVDGKNRVASSTLVRTDDVAGYSYLNTYEWYDDVLNPEPTSFLGANGGLDPSTGKIYALKKNVYQKQYNGSPVDRSQAYEYNYTKNASGYAINTLEGTSLRVKYIYK